MWGQPCRTEYELSDIKVGEEYVGNQYISPQYLKGAILKAEKITKKNVIMTTTFYEGDRFSVAPHMLEIREEDKSLPKTVVRYA